MKLLWYDKPAGKFISGLPIGTGRLKAMIFGGVETERIALNHEWLWRGLWRNREPDKSAHRLSEVRQLLLEGKYEEGTIKGNDAFAGGGGSIRKQKPGRVDPYQPAGDLCLSVQHGAVTNYRRELDIANAIATVQYEADGIRFSREYMANIPNDLILMRLAASAPTTTTVRLGRTEDPACFLHLTAREELLAMDGHFEKGLSFRIEARVCSHNGTATVHGDVLTICSATEIVLAVDIGTSARNEAPAHECARQVFPETARWEEIKAKHINAYRALYDGIQLRIDAPPEPDLPTDERLARLNRREAEDPTLAVLFFNYGRYAHIAATATAQLPPNLQGGWNDDIKPPWECDYHADINMQVNYWLAEPAGLSTGTEQLFRFIERFVPHARKCAHDLYGCRGVCFPIQMDPWGRATPESHGWAAWIGAAPWLAQHLWWHYEFGLDETFLRERAYPFFREVLAFYEDYLVEDPNGVLQIVPSQSPENRFVGSGKLAVSLCVSTTMDVQLLESVLEWAVRSSEILGCDETDRERWHGMLGKLPPRKVGSHGELLEWNEEFEENDINHRHFSHLFGVYPGDLYGPERKPELFEAAKISLERRLTDPTRGHVGWRLLWIALLYARFGDRANAWAWLNHLVASYAEQDHVNEPHHTPLFQIEGFQGCTATVCEMLLQSWREELHLLPCLPDSWPNGEVKGIRARGGYTLDISWEHGKLKEALIRPSVTRRCTLIHAENIRIRDEAGNDVPTSRQGHKLSFEAEAETVYRCTVV